MGLLSAFANRGSEDDAESFVSDESTTEEFTEEETLSSSTSTGTDEGSDESNPPPKKTISRKPRKKNEGRLWQHNLSARSNQDIQRAYEENVIKEMSAILSRKTIGETMSRTNRSTGKNCIPIGGLWVKLEAEWRENLNSRDLQSKMKNVISSRLYKSKGKF
ncbi:hypothetical protein GWI33_015081 [Rhynchophorus ferrugineus]|uniref:Uncharacterized protein n=1 Tax=Rhynchophorus ferrugineus TaxID=354439 RepID=A0A834I056_RHYFE|nr:hypothetical protein GWI33_015081 [Rhynchophorus ferrugineus]